VKLNILLVAGGILLVFGAWRSVPLAAARGPAAQASNPACSLLVTADVRSIFGPDAAMASHRTVGLFGTCSYSTRQGTLSFVATSTSFIQQQRLGVSTAAQRFAEIQTTIPGQVQLITGLGTKALWSTSLHQLWVLDGDTLFSLSQFSPGNGALTQLERVARKVLVHI
jgi:hypothetical protein